ncbi:glycoside hydrolase family 97 catalytic domain-containing protein [Streptomyces hirsutus]
MGVDYEVGGRGGVAFEALADGRVLATTGVLTGADPARRIDVESPERSG